MTVAVYGSVIALSGVASVEDAETLLSALVDHPDHRIDVGDLTTAHLAVIQVLLSAKRPLARAPLDAVLRDFVLAGLIEVDRR